MREDSLARKCALMKEAAFFLRNVGTYLIGLHRVKSQKTVIVTVCIYIHIYTLICDYMRVHYTKSWDLACGKKRGEKGIKKVARKKDRQRLERGNERSGSKKK